MNFCLPEVLVNKFKEALKNGEIDPAKLSEMSSQERHSFLSKYVGEENARRVNADFESRLLLKSQQTGIINWAKSVSGMKPETLRDIVSRVDRMTEILQPKEMDDFLSDLAEQRLGFKISRGDAALVSEAAREVMLAKDKMVTRDTFASDADRLDYGAKFVAFKNLVGELKDKVTEQSAIEQLKSPAKAVINLGGIAKSAKAALDVSMLLRQGFKASITEPKIWLKEAKQVFSDIVKTFKGENVLDGVKADIYSRPNALNGSYAREKLAIGIKEEAYPSSVLEKIPAGIGTMFKASEQSFTAFQYRLRADIFDKLQQSITASHGSTEGLGRFVNSLTGRGSLGKLEPAANAVNNLFFSPRNVWSNVEFLTAHQFDRSMSPELRIRAATNLLKVIGTVATVLTIAKALDHKSVEEDPRSSDFGKIRIGDTRFDVTAGMSSLAVLASRLLTMSSKSGTTGRVSGLNSGQYGSQTLEDVLINYTEGKLSPLASVVKDMMKGQDFSGNKPTLSREAINLMAPLPITNAYEAYSNPKAAPLILTIIADGLGIGANTYSQTTNWNLNPGKELQAFKSKVGEEKFTQANNDYNKEFSKWYESVRENPSYNKLSPEEQTSVINKKKSDLKDQVLRSYNFVYTPPRTKKLPNF
jgi:hypothetical protein